MALPLKILLGLGLFATLAVLVWGLITMARGGENASARSNRLMRLRVLFQGLALLFFLLLIWATRR